MLAVMLADCLVSRQTVVAAAAEAMMTHVGGGCWPLLALAGQEGERGEGAIMVFSRCYH